MNDLVDQLGVVVGIVHEIKLGGIDNKGRRLVVMEEKMVIGLVEMRDVPRIHVVFIRPSAPFDAAQQHIG